MTNSITNLPKNHSKMIHLSHTSIHSKYVLLYKRNWFLHQAHPSQRIQISRRKYNFIANGQRGVIKLALKRSPPNVYKRIKAQAEGRQGLQYTLAGTHTHTRSQRRVDVIGVARARAAFRNFLIAADCFVTATYNSYKIHDCTS